MPCNYIRIADMWNDDNRIWESAYHGRLFSELESGVCTIVPDDLDNVYDMTGPGFSYYKP